jgi:hypothetical protein
MGVAIRIPSSARVGIEAFGMREKSAYGHPAQGALVNEPVPWALALGHDDRHACIGTNPHDRLRKSRAKQEPGLQAWARDQRRAAVAPMPDRLAAQRSRGGKWTGSARRRQRVPRAVGIARSSASEGLGVRRRRCAAGTGGCDQRRERHQLDAQGPRGARKARLRLIASVREHEDRGPLGAKPVPV